MKVKMNLPSTGVNFIFSPIILFSVLNTSISLLFKLFTFLYTSKVISVFGEERITEINSPIAVSLPIISLSFIFRMTSLIFIPAKMK